MGTPRGLGRSEEGREEGSLPGWAVPHARLSVPCAPQEKDRASLSRHWAASSRAPGRLSGLCSPHFCREGTSSVGESWSRAARRRRARTLENKCTLQEVKNGGRFLLSKKLYVM